MNILAEKQFKENCKSFEFSRDFFEGKKYLENLGNLMYDKLSKEDQSKVHEMIDQMIFMWEVIYNLIMDDYYLSKWFKKIGIIFTKKNGENFQITLSNHYNNMLKYIDYFDNSYKICERPKSDLNMCDLENTYVLTYLSFVTLINDCAQADFNLLNKKKYRDSDIKDFSEVKKQLMHVLKP